ncbi:MAG: homoserine kinase [Chloroflexi bacterium]|nr:MAG: homoserine kinase [Chloroflexota bacterium]
MQVTVTVPATTANLGPGFDCLGLALGLYNQITVITSDVPAARLEVLVTGEGQGQIPTDEANLVIRAMETLFARVGKRPFLQQLRQTNHIPVSSGLGSSAAATLAGLLAANALLANPLSQADILQLATQMEGHPDNVAPALYGGLTLALTTKQGVQVTRLPISPMQVVVVLPDFSLSTAAARAALPTHVPLADAVFNVGRMGLLVHALQAGDYDALAEAMQDRLHQPYRLPLIPGTTEAFQAARRAGAAGVALSGAGPSLVAFAPGQHETIRTAVINAFRQVGLTSRSWILPIVQQGSVVAVENHEN